MLDLMNDMDTVFLASGWEESVSYVISGTIPVTKTINAIVFRGAENRINLNIKQSGGDIARKYDIEIYVSRTDIPSVKVNADKVICKRLPGDSSTSTFNVVGIIKMDTGAYRLGLA